MAANEAFSINDLKQFTSNIKYDDSQEGEEAKILKKEPPTILVEQPEAAVELSTQAPLPQPPMDHTSSNLSSHNNAQQPQQQSSQLSRSSTAEESVYSTTLIFGQEDGEAASYAGQSDVQQPQKQSSQLSRSSTAEESVYSTTLIFGQEDGVVASYAGQNDVQEQEQQEQQLPQLSRSSSETGWDVEALSAGEDGIREGNADDQPLSERLVSKNWKVRLGALEGLQQMFKNASGSNDPVFNEYEGMLPKMLCDSNSSCMDAAIEVAAIYAERCNNAGSKAAGIAKSIVSCGLSGRPSAISASEALLLKLMEVRVCVSSHNSVGRKWCRHHLFF